MRLLPEMCIRDRPEYYEDQDKMDKLFTRQAELQDIIDATDAWNLDSKLELSLIHI